MEEPRKSVPLEEEEEVTEREETEGEVEGYGMHPTPLPGIMGVIQEPVP